MRTLDLILHNKTIYIFCPWRAHDYMNFTYICNFSCILSTGNIHQVNKTDTPCYIYIYCAYTLFFLFHPFSAYPKPMTAFPEERKDDEDIYMYYDDCCCLTWKEILSLTDGYYQVNLFLIKNNTIIFKNYILPKSLCYDLTSQWEERKEAEDDQHKKPIKVDWFEDKSIGSKVKWPGTYSAHTLRLANVVLQKMLISGLCTHVSRGGVQPSCNVPLVSMHMTKRHARMELHIWSSAFTCTQGGFESGPSQRHQPKSPRGIR
jgi:hypothetical protein